MACHESIRPVNVAKNPITCTQPCNERNTTSVPPGVRASRIEFDAEQRARMAMLGFEARLTEREQAGQTVYRVRLGPFEKKDAAEAAREKLTESGVESALVRVQR